MKCKYITVRTEKKSKFFFCRLYKRQIPLNLVQCKECADFKYKEYKPINKRTKKQVKLENSRFSIITDDLKHCYICTERGIKDITKDDLHEVYGGSNRKRSIENGLVVPLCRQCHEDYEIQKFLKRFVQLEYEERHTREEFIKLIGRSYL